MSHSHTSTLLVKEIRKYLPSQFDLWIDEKELRAGAPLEDSLKKAIWKDCDFLVVVIDQDSIQSPWVKKEIRWALEKEEEIGRTFLLAIVTDEKAFKKLANQKLKVKKYITCYNQQDIQIEAVSKVLSNEIIALVCQMLESGNTQADKTMNNTIDQVNTMILEMERMIKTILYRYRENNPFSISDLETELQKKRNTYSVRNLRELLLKLRSMGYLKGIYFDDQSIYLEKDSYQYKVGMYQDMKKRIAKTASTLIKPGDSIAIDGGTTTMELAKLISNALYKGQLYKLTVITNSLLVANEIVGTLSSMNVPDTNSVCAVYISGGLARPTSLTVIPDSQKNLHVCARLEGLFQKIGYATVGFLGASGIKKNRGFSMKHTYEIPAKTDIITYSRKRVILTDPSKFTVEQDEVFAEFDTPLSIITVHSPEFSKEITLLQKHIAHTGSELIFA